MSSRKNHDLVFKALADSRRRKILDLLKDEPKTTGDICSHFKSLDRCTVMQHLGVLERAGLVTSTKTGRVRTYRLAPAALEAADGWLAEQRSLWQQRAAAAASTAPRTLDHRSSESRASRR